MTVILSTLIEIYTANPVTHSCLLEFDQVSDKPRLRSLLSLGASSLYPKKKNFRKKKKKIQMVYEEEKYWNRSFTFKLLSVAQLDILCERT